MTDRRVMVMDNNNDLIEIIRNSLTPYGYEAELVEAGEKGIHIVKSLRPKAVFVAAEQSDKSMLALCSKAKKVAGSQIPVILISSNIPKSDLNLHGKQRYHADLYLNKKDFLNGEFVKKVSTLIDLKPIEQVNAMPFSNSSLPDAAKERLVGQSDKPLDAASEELLKNETLDESLRVLDDEPFWLADLYKKIVSEDTNDKGKDSSQTENDVDRYLSEESYADDDIEQRIHEQEIEIAGLRAKIEETQREARSSPFSRDYLNLREGLAQKERQVVQLTEKLEKYRSKTLIGDKRLKDLAKRMFDLKAELEQGQAREKELSLRHETVHAELAKMNATINESKGYYDAIIDKINAEHEVSITNLSKNHKETIDSLEKQIQQEKINAKNFKESEYQKKLDKLQIEHQAMIDSLNEQIEKEKNKAANFKESEYQKKLDKLQIEHQAMIDSLNEQIEKEKTKASNATDIKWQKRIEKKQREYDKSIEQLKKDHKSEFESFRSGADGVQDLLDTEINALMVEHKSTLDRLEEEHCATVASLKKEIEKEKETAEARVKAILDSRQEFETLQKEHIAFVPKLKKEHAKEVTRLNAELKKSIKTHQEDLKTLDKKYKQDLHELDTEYSLEFAEIKKEKSTEIDDLKKKAAREAEKSAEMLEEEQKAHKETRIRLESKLAAKLVTDAKKGSI